MIGIPCFEALDIVEHHDSSGATVGFPHPLAGPEAAEAERPGASRCEDAMSLGVVGRGWAREWWPLEPVQGTLGLRSVDVLGNLARLMVKL